MVCPGMGGLARSHMHAVLSLPAPEEKRVGGVLRKPELWSVGAPKHKGQLKTHVEHRTTSFASLTLPVSAAKHIAVGGSV